MRRILLLVLVVTGCATTEATTESAGTTASTPAREPAADEKALAKKRFDSLIDTEWEWAMREFPEYATYVGDFRYNDKLTDLSVEAVAARKAHTIESLAALDAIDRNLLDQRTQLDYDVLAFDLRTEALAAQKFPTEVLQVTHMGGIHTAMADLAQAAPRETVKQCEDFIARMVATPKQLEQATVLLRRGLASSITPPKALLERLPDLVKNQIPADPIASPIYTAYFSKMLDTVAQPEQQRLRDRALAVLREQVYPAYTAFADFIKNEYVPRARTSLAWTQVQDGVDWYAWNIRKMTTLSMSAEEIHNLGLSEVKRIRAEMEQVKAEAKFSKDLPAFFTFLRTDKRFFYSDKDALVSGYRDIAKRIDAQLPRLFGKLPRLTYGVEPVPAFAEKVQTTAYYQPGTAAGARAGIFFCNTYDLKSRPKWEMEALTLHEAVPGHHLQISLAEEVENAPAYRKYAFNNAYVEGWALYAESLGESIGMYRDPYTKFGRLTYEMWRAIRLVVDTGIHAKGWTREQAIAFFAENAGRAQHDIEVEVDRYTVWPAQALGYKLGELKIKALRAKAADVLKEKFDLRAFHDTILDDGALPLEVLEAHVDRWIDTQRVR